MEDVSKEIRNLVEEHDYTLIDFFKDGGFDVWDVEEFLREIEYETPVENMRWNDRRFIREVLEHLDDDGLIFRLFEEMSFLGIADTEER